MNASRNVDVIDVNDTLNTLKVIQLILICALRQLQAQQQRHQQLQQVEHNSATERKIVAAKFNMICSPITASPHVTLMLSKWQSMCTRCNSGHTVSGHGIKVNTDSVCLMQYYLEGLEDMAVHVVLQTPPQHLGKHEVHPMR